jgi:hypothetical protein
MPKKAPVSVERQRLLDALKVSQNEKKKERLGFVDYGSMNTARCATKPRKGEEEGVAHMINKKGGGDTRIGGGVVKFDNPHDE